MASHLRCLLFRENGDFHGRVLARIGGLGKTQVAVNGRIIVFDDGMITPDSTRFSLWMRIRFIDDLIAIGGML